MQDGLNDWNEISSLITMDEYHFHLISKYSLARPNLYIDIVTKTERRMLVCFNMPKRYSLVDFINDTVYFYIQVPDIVALAMQVNIHPKSMTLSKVVMLGKRGITMQFYPAVYRQLKNQQSNINLTTTRINLQLSNCNFNSVLVLF